jgi:hypothetical protein
MFVLQIQSFGSYIRLSGQKTPAPFFGISPPPSPPAEASQIVWTDWVNFDSGLEARAPGTGPVDVFDKRGIRPTSLAPKDNDAYSETSVNIFPEPVDRKMNNVKHQGYITNDGIVRQGYTTYDGIMRQGYIVRTGGTKLGEGREVGFVVQKAGKSDLPHPIRLLNFLRKNRGTHYTAQEAEDESGVAHGTMSILINQADKWKDSKIRTKMKKTLVKGSSKKPSKMQDIMEVWYKPR